MIRSCRKKSIYLEKWVDILGIKEEEWDSSLTHNMAMIQLWLLAQNGIWVKYLAKSFIYYVYIHHKDFFETPP